MCKSCEVSLKRFYFLAEAGKELCFEELLIVDFALETLEKCICCLASKLKILPAAEIERIDNLAVLLLYAVPVVLLYQILPFPVDSSDKLVLYLEEALEELILR